MFDCVRCTSLIWQTTVTHADDVHTRRTQAQLTELDGQKLARGAEAGARRVLRSEAEARAAAERVAAATLAVKAASRKVNSSCRGAEQPGQAAASQSVAVLDHRLADVRVLIELF